MTDASFARLPDPHAQSEFYDGVAIKRLLAWVVDIALIGICSAILATLPLFIGWFFFPFIFLTISLIYRIGTIASASATPGMRLFNIELRTHDGQMLDGGVAAIHTIAYMIASAFFLPQLISVILMLTQPRGQGLHDLLTGVAAINRAG